MLGPPLAAPCSWCRHPRPVPRGLHSVPQHGGAPWGPPPPLGSAPPVVWHTSHAPAHPLYGAAAGGTPNATPPARDQTALIHALNNIRVQQGQASSPSTEWYLDTGASTHMAPSSGILSSCHPCYSSRIVVGNGSSLVVTHTGYHNIPTTTNALSLHNVLVSPNLTKIFIPAKALARDNPINVEFDDHGLC